MRAIEADNEELKDILPKTYNRLENNTLATLLKNFNSIPMGLRSITPVSTISRRSSRC